MTTHTDEELIAIAKAAEKIAPGSWEHDTEKSDGAYGSGPDAQHGFATYLMLDAEGRRLFDAHGSEVAEIHEEYDEDGGQAWDENSRQVFAFIATFNPAAVIALLERVERAETRVTALEAGILQAQESLRDNPDNGDVVWFDLITTMWEHLEILRDPDELNPCPVEVGQDHIRTLSRAEALQAAEARAIAAEGALKEAKDVAGVFANHWPYGVDPAADDILRRALCAVQPALTPSSPQEA